MAGSDSRPRPRWPEIARIRFATERRRSRTRVRTLVPVRSIRRANLVSRDTACEQRPESVGVLMSASTNVASTRNRRERSTRRSTANANSSALSSSSSSGPSRLVSFTSVDECGTRPSSAIRQKRRQVNESATSLHNVS